MIRPHGSSPPSFARARTGAGRYSGFQAFSVGSHHFVGTLDLIALGGENSLSNSLARSGRDRSVVVWAAPRHQHEDDARDLVGERHRGQLMEWPAPPSGVVGLPAVQEEELDMALAAISVLGVDLGKNVCRWSGWIRPAQSLCVAR